MTWINKCLQINPGSYGTLKINAGRKEDMSGICSAHQGYDPDCRLCNSIPKGKKYELRNEVYKKFVQAHILRPYHNFGFDK